MPRLKNVVWGATFISWLSLGRDSTIQWQMKASIDSDGSQNLIEDVVQNRSPHDHISLSMLEGNDCWLTMD